MPRRRRRKTNATGRNEKDGQFLPIPYVMARSPAFRSLNGTSLKVWVELRTRFNGQNNGMVSLSLREAADLLGMSQSTAQRAFRELEEKGFVVRRLSGSWYGRKAAEFILTDCRYDGLPASRDWQRWRPNNKSSVPRRTAKQRGGSPEYRDPELAGRESSRQRNFKVINGAV